MWPERWHDCSRDNDQSHVTAKVQSKDSCCEPDNTESPTLFHQVSFSDINL